MKKCLSAMCGQGSLPVNEGGWCEVRRSGELGESLEVDLAYQTCWIFWIARGDTCLEAVHMR